MKIRSEHYQYLLNAIKPMASKIAEHRAFIIEEGKAKDVETRLAWDLLWLSVPSNWVCDNLYPYMDNSHLNTAVKSILKTLEGAQP